MGNAIAIGLRQGLMDAGVPVHYDTELTDLVIEDGRVVGVRASPGTAPEAVVRARRGVILGSGGFEHNLEMRERLPAAADVGRLDDRIAVQHRRRDPRRDRRRPRPDLMDDAWWGRRSRCRPGRGSAWPSAMPGSIIVNQAGQRFANEALPYVEAMHEIYRGEATGVGHVLAWMVIDQRYRNRYLFAGLSPRQPFPAAGTRTARWSGRDAGGAGRADRRASRRSHRDGPAVQRLRRDRRRRRLPPRESAYDKYYPTHREAEPVAARHRPGAVLRGQDRARRPRDQGGLVTDERPRGAGGRVGGRRAVRRRQLLRGRDGSHLRGPGPPSAPP